MFSNLVSYTVSDYEARWIDVVVLEKVAEIVAQEINAGAGTDSVDAEALKDSLKDSLLGSTADSATAVVLNARTGEAAVVGTDLNAEAREAVAAGMGVRTDTLVAAAHDIARQMLDPVQADAMVASSAEAEATGGVSALSTAVATQVAARLGVAAAAAAVEAETATPLTPLPDALQVTGDTVAVAEAIGSTTSLSVVETEVGVAVVNDAANASTVTGLAAPSLVVVHAGVSEDDRAETSVLHQIITAYVPPVGIDGASPRHEDDATPAPAQRPPAVPGVVAMAVAAAAAISDAAQHIRYVWRPVIKRVLVWVERRRLVTRLQENASVAEQVRELKRSEGERQDEKAYLRKLAQKQDAQWREALQAAHKLGEEQAQAVHAQSLRADALNAEDRARSAAVQARALPRGG